MKKGGWASLDWPNGLQYFRVAVVGTGASAPIAPVDGAVQPNFPKKCNALSRLAAEIPARSGVGAYTVQYDGDFSVHKILMATAEVYSAAAGMWCQVQAISTATRTLTLKVFNAAGAATDLAVTTDLLVIDVCCQDSNS